MGYFIFYPYIGMDVKIQGVTGLWFFPEFSILRYIFPGGKFAVFTFFWGDRLKNFFSGIIFFWGIELSKIKFQGIYESNNHSFQSILVFQNLGIYTPVWIKNGIAQLHLNWSNIIDAVDRVVFLYCHIESWDFWHNFWPSTNKQREKL